MRLFSRIEDKRSVDEPDYVPPLDPPELGPVEEPEEHYTVNPVGIGLAVLGGVLLVCILPLDEPSSVFERIQENTLIQHEGSIAVTLGATIVLAAASSNPKSIAVCILSVIAGGLIVYTGLDKSLRALLPIGSGGEAEATGKGIVVPLGTRDLHCRSRGGVGIRWGLDDVPTSKGRELQRRRAAMPRMRGDDPRRRTSLQALRLSL